MEHLNNKLAEKAYKSDYFKELIEKMEVNYVNKLFDLYFQEKLDMKERNDLLRFADIFASSSKARYKNLANKIVSLMHNVYNDDVLDAYFYSVCIKLGLFSNMESKNEEVYEKLPFELLLQHNLKESIQKDKYLENVIYTDAQFEVVEELANANHFSLSAPTSFGKTLIMMNQINRILNVQKEANFCLLVPTNALLKEISEELRETFLGRKIRIVNYPEISKADLKATNIIFVFTPERLNKYFNLKNRLKIDYLFVDEAQNIVKLNESRTPLFYHVIELASYHSSKIFFIAPFINNPSILLELINKNPEYSKLVENRLVNQNKIIIDYQMKKSNYVSYNNNLVSFNYNFIDDSASNEKKIKHIIDCIGSDKSTLIYFSSKSKMFSSIISLMELYEDLENENLNEFSEQIKKSIHDNYILVKSLKKGIACHFGQLPKNIREKIEELFKDGTIKILLSTSTLLQGVNLPASNIIVTSTKNGKSDLSNLDLSNLVGRAGRYGKNLNGNVIFLNINNNIKKELIGNCNDIQLKSDVVNDSRRRNFYKDIGGILKENKVVSTSLSEKKINIIGGYSNIAIIHNELKINSVLNTNLKNITKDVDIFKKGKYAVYENFELFKEHVDIPFEKQKEVYEGTDFFQINIDNLNIQEVNRLLEEVNSLYGDSITGKINNRRGYYSKLLVDWIEGKDLKFIIKNTINFYEENPDKYFSYERNYEQFDVKNSIHVNKVINDTIEDIEDIIKFKLKKTITNYIKLKKEDNMDECKKMSDFLEFGSKNSLIIKMQKNGFSRELSFYLKDKYHKFIEVIEEDLVIDYYSIEEMFDKKHYLFEEFLDIYKYEKSFDETV